MEFKDYYKILGVSKTATQEDIQKTYRKLAKKYHPDKNKESGSETRFKEIGEAYDVLKDPEKRAKYDQYGAAWKAAANGHQTPPGFDGVRFEFGGNGFGQGESFFDILEHMFGHGGGHSGFGGFGKRTWQAKGEDVEARLPLTLEEAMRGGKHTLSLSDPQTGRQKAYTVNIPAGVHSGKRIRLAGQGRDGIGSGQAGDLYLVVELLDHPQFEVKGNHIYTTLEVLPYQAALGDKVVVDTPDGQLRINLPPRSSSGQKIRLKGRGLGDQGDLYVEVKIVIPDVLTPREQALYEQLAQEARTAI